MTDRKLCTFRLDEKTRTALEKKAKELGTSQANAIGVTLGAMPESAYAPADKRGKLVVR
jgi:hypothetical protein